MAEPRKSAKLTAARGRAREQAAQFREREDALEALAVEYFTQIGEVEEITVAQEKEVERVRSEGRELIAHRERNAAAAIVSMLATGTSRAEVATRLGVSAKVVRDSSATADASVAVNDAAGSDSV